MVNRTKVTIECELPWIFPGNPLTFNGAPGNIQGNLDRCWPRCFQKVISEYGLEEVLLGMASQIAEREDHILVNDVRGQWEGNWMGYLRRCFWTVPSLQMTWKGWEITNILSLAMNIWRIALILFPAMNIWHMSLILSATMNIWHIALI